jgi:2,4-dienoyl-CoA reductase [(3E)-enoyl-CoA-producing], peroxisomal
MAGTEADACLAGFKSPFRADLLRGKVALVTGGGSGIGFRISELLLRHGCTVVIASRSLSRLEEAAHKLRVGTGCDACDAVQCDVRSLEATEAAVAYVIRHHHRLDILINCAAGNFLAPASQLSANAFKTVIDIDLVGTFNCCRSAFNGWMREHGGSIINISATLHYRGDPLQAHAGSAKAAIDALCKHLAREWGSEGVRVNNIAPGPIDDTEGFRRLGGFLPPASLERAKKLIPAGRFGHKHEIAAAVVFLSSDETAGFITGHTLVVDGGAWMSGLVDGMMAELATRSAKL